MSIADRCQTDPAQPLHEQLLAEVEDRYAAVMWGYQFGYDAGWNEGRADLLAEARHAVAARIVMAGTR